MAGGDRRSLDSPSSETQRRSPAIDLDTIVRSNLDAIVIGLAIGLLVVLLLLVLQVRRMRRLGRRLDRLASGSDGASLEAVLGESLERVRGAMVELERLDGRTARVEADLRSTLGHVGLVRYNPFEDTGGQLSFALAILDGAGNGVVVNGLHARAGTRVYAKSITGGRSEATLSKEETEAVRQALTSATQPSAPGGRA